MSCLQVMKEHETCVVCWLPSQSKSIAKYFPYKEIKTSNINVCELHLEFKYSDVILIAVFHAPLSPLIWHLLNS